ncbi:MAG: POTRA domain-containing protein, partial [Methylophilaceae bacterium]
MQKKLLILILIFFNFSVYSADGHIVRDIKIEGLQRVDPGFVFDNISFEIDDLIEEVNFSQAINLLYKTGQFKDISIELEGRDIIIVVSERPIISQIHFHGTETFQPKRLIDGIASMNIASGLVLDKSVLKKVEKELINQYLSYGKYSASIKTIVTPLQRNRVDIDFYIDEGTNSRIKEISIVGATKFSQEDLLGLLELQTTSFMSWWNQDDRYSKQKLTGDLERIRSFYMNRGYMDFSIKNTTVNISKSKRNVYITIIVEEGLKYTFGETKISGNYYPLKESDLLDRIQTKKGNVFNRQEVTKSTEAINEKLGNFG